MFQQTIGMLILGGCMLSCLAGCGQDDSQRTGIYQVQIPGNEGSPIPLWASADSMTYCGERAKKPEPSADYCKTQLVGLMISPGYANVLAQTGELAHIRGMEGRTIGARGWVYKDWIKEMSEANLQVIREQRAETTVVDELEHVFSHIKQRLDF